MTKMPKRRSVSTVLGCLSCAILAMSLGGCAAHTAYRDGQQEEARKHWDLAVMAYQKAVEQDPESLRYKTALTMAKMRAAIAHFEKGKLYKASGQLELAAIELEQAIALDRTIEAAAQELDAVKKMIDATKAEIQTGTAIEKAKAKTKGSRATPPMLNPASDKPIDLVFPQETNIKRLYGVLASAAGINIIYDPQLKDDKYAIDLRAVTFQKGLEVLMRQAGHFYKVLDEKTILIAQDNNQNRREYEDLVIRTFFLSNGDVKDVSNMVRSILDLRRLGVIPQLNAIVIRDTADKVAVAEKIIEVNDKAKAEVIVDVELVQLNTAKTLELGTKLSSYSTTAGLYGSDGKAITNLPWDQLTKISISDFSFSIPTVTFNFIKNNTDATVLAKPALRISEGEKAQLVIGDRVPIPVTTISAQTAVGSTGVVPITSFQYQDVGIKIDIEPRVHHNKEVTMKLTVEVSQITDKGTATAGSPAQPTIGTRTITSTIRLRDGETNVLAGLIRTDTTKGRTTVPFLGDIPLLGTLFTNVSDDIRRTDLLLTLTPRIIRAPQISEEDLTPIWVGTENNVSFSGLNVRLESPSAPGSPFDPQPTEASEVKRNARPGMVGGQTRPMMPMSAPINPASALAPGKGPSDPFKTSTSSPKNVANEGTLEEPAETPVAVPKTSEFVLGFETPASEIRPDSASYLVIQAPPEMAELNALELTLEWDPAVVQVNGVSAGSWSDANADGQVRFNSERVEGRALIQLSRAGNAIGLPQGALARVDFKGRSAGVSLFRLSAAAALGRNGPVRPQAEALLVTVKE